MSILDQLEEAFGKERKAIEVNLGEGRGSVLLYTTPVSMGDIDRAKRKNSDMTSGEFMVELLIAKCEQEDGKKLWTIEDKPRLLRLAAGPIASIFNQVFSSSSVEAHLKN